MIVLSIGGAKSTAPPGEALRAAPAPHVVGRPGEVR